MLLWKFVYKSSWRCIFSCLLGKYWQVEYLGNMVNICLTLKKKKKPNYFPKWLYHITINTMRACFCTSLPILGTVTLSIFSHSNEYVVVLYCGFNLPDGYWCWMSFMCLSPCVLSSLWVDTSPLIYILWIFSHLWLAFSFS